MRWGSILAGFLLLTPWVSVRGKPVNTRPWVMTLHLATFVHRADATSVLADGTDWVSPEYLIDQRTNPIQDTASAKKSLISIAGTYGRKGPWSKCSVLVSCKEVRNLIAAVRRAYPSKSSAPQQQPERLHELCALVSRSLFHIVPVRKLIASPHSYWPDCNWCPSKKQRRDEMNGFTPYDIASPPPWTSSAHRRRKAHWRRGAESVIQIPKVGADEVVPAPLQSPPTEVLASLPVITGSSTGTSPTPAPTDEVMTGTPDPALAKAKTTQASPCSTSPTKSMPPSASESSKLLLVSCPP